MATCRMTCLSSLRIFRDLDAAAPLWAAMLSGSLLLWPQLAFAQESTEAPTEGQDSADMLDGDSTEDSLSDLDEEEEVPVQDETVPVEEAPAEGAAEPEEAKGADASSKAILVGLRHRMIVVPKWLVNSFGLDGGKTFVTQGFGGEVGGYFGEAANGFMVLGSVWWAPYRVDDFLFKGKKDEDVEWEVIDSDMNSLYITLDAAWDFRLVQKLSLNVGLGVGVGVVTGKLYRNETYLDGSGSADYPADDDHPALSKCTGPGIGAPGIPNGQCDPDGDYGESDRWPVYPWLNFQLGLRYQVVDEFAARLDMGVGSSGFWVGIGADYSHWL